MWYLIIPPIIVVVSLLFVLWYLSRKGADPLIAEKVSKLEEEAGQQVSFLRTKTFSLHLLEKTAYRFKVASLQMHNALHNLTQSLKEKQRRFQEKAPMQESSERAAEQENVSGEEQQAPRLGNSRRFFGRDREIEAVAEKEQVIFFQAKKEVLAKKETVYATASTEPLLVSRPMVSEAATHPERTRKKMQTNSFREEDLIARIAANPKDFTAYEGLGDYYLENDNVKDAKECYRQVLKLSPIQRMVKIKIRRLEKIISQRAE